MSRRQVNLRSKGLIKRPSTSTDATMSDAKRSIPNDFYRGELDFWFFSVRHRTCGRTRFILMQFVAIDFASQKISDDAEESPSTDVSTTEDSEEDEAVLYDPSLNDPSTSQSTKCKCGADEAIRSTNYDAISLLAMS